MTSAPDLISLVLSLSPLDLYPQKEKSDEQRVLPQWWGRAAHALILQTIQIYNPALAASIHDDQSAPRPFTVSTLMGEKIYKTLNPESKYTLRLTAFSKTAAACLTAAIQPKGYLAAGQTIELDYFLMHINAVYSSPQEHPWAQITSYQTLSSPYLLAKVSPQRSLTLQFTSPTTFKTNEMYYPFPSPSLVFNSLLARWNTFAPVTFPPEVRRYAESCLAVSRYRLSTRRVPLKNGGIRSGCVGEIRFSTTHYDRYWMSLIHLLAQYSIFTGVGAGTGMGLGQSRLIERQHPNTNANNI